MSVPDTMPFNPLDPAMAVDPYPHYRRLREQASGVHEIGGIGMYVLTRHDDVAAFYKDRRLEMRYHDRETARYGPDVVEQPFYRSFQQMAFFRDHGEHRPLRQMFAHAFTNDRVDQLRRRMREVADDLMTRKLPDGGMEFVSEFCEPYPRIIIGEMLGIPDADNERIGEWALALAAAFEFLPLTPERIVEVNGHVESLTEYLTWLAGERSERPQGDLFSSMLQAAAESDGAISLDVVIANTIILYVGGHETTSGAMGLSLLALNRQPGAFQELKRDPELIPRAVEELLRFEVATQGTGRIAGADVEYGGVEIPAGSLMLAYIGA